MTDPQRKAARGPSQESGQGNDSFEDLVTLHDPTGAASEAYRMLRTSLFYAVVDTPPKVIVLTSPSPGEGKSTTTANLGVTLAQVGKSVLTLDCDLRRPRLHSMFDVHNETGLADILTGGHKMEEVWREPIPGLKLICAGPPPPNPAELLSSQRFAEFLSEMRRKFDYVLVDTPPVGRADAAVLAASADGVLLILDSQRTRKGSLRQALRGLRGVGANVLGTVMNNFEVSRGGNTPYSYPY
ncbi:MAG: CpsD/CapB family tyrosine-protein kinase [Chloroflexota bacterium]|nr:CpsD/CapB family tyrosine-protein kinase [Chloroflexota bacterium]